jgi:hypothetical protein
LRAAGCGAISSREGKRQPTRPKSGRAVRCQTSRNIRRLLRTYPTGRIAPIMIPQSMNGPLANGRPDVAIAVNVLNRTPELDARTTFVSYETETVGHPCNKVATRRYSAVPQRR